MNLEEVLAEFQRAAQALRAAEVLHAEELFPDAISRAYYAVMHAAKAALLTRDVVADSRPPDLLPC